ncbi:hypothetical protein [Streptomyces sp. NBC_01766]|uniref:hypothetical protein n=1 Tax=Streptomyces sp. NBC_01766 TaxID=2975936 RepID=UPI002DDA152A|nr:hypothetical protein [Streptomyces sp. NBC_01766]WSC22326.1 hypothetical protein OIE60_23030 [Streptomyces sp. NBC_01766]
MPRLGEIVLFVVEDPAFSAEVPVGGRIGYVADADPAALASRVGRVVARYQVDPRRTFWIETTAYDAALVQRILTTCLTSRWRRAPTPTALP